MHCIFVFVFIVYRNWYMYRYGWGMQKGERRMDSEGLEWRKGKWYVYVYVAVFR